jgi:hypothetical protein
MTPDSLRRLLADLPGPESPHPIDAGLLGEYALVERVRGPGATAEAYPRVAAHLRTECQRCQDTLAAVRTLARRSGAPRGQAQPARPPTSPPREPSSETAAVPEAATLPEPLEIAEAVALARAIEAERDALRAPLRPDRSGQVDTRRQAARRRQLLLVEAALIRQRLIARRLFLNRASVLLSSPSPAAGRGGRVGRAGASPNPKARLLLDDFAGGVDELTRLTGRVGRLTADLRRLGDDPNGPARSHSEALTNRGLTMTREALAVDRRLARLQGILAGMVT